MSLAGRTVLVADDNQDIRDLITIILEDSSISVLSAEDGVNALTQASSHKPDLILLDVMMPGLSGIQTLERIRNHEDSEVQKIPVVMITAKSQSEDIDKALLAGADSYIIKPFQTGLLIEKISSILQIGGK